MNTKQSYIGEIIDGLVGDTTPQIRAVLPIVKHWLKGMTDDEIDKIIDKLAKIVNDYLEHYGNR